MVLWCDREIEERHGIFCVLSMWGEVRVYR